MNQYIVCIVQNTWPSIPYNNTDHPVGCVRQPFTPFYCSSYARKVRGLIDLLVFVTVPTILTVR